jgi:hypothetical protein
VARLARIQARLGDESSQFGDFGQNDSSDIEARQREPTMNCDVKALDSQSIAAMKMLESIVDVKLLSANFESKL